MKWNSRNSAPRDVAVLIRYRDEWRGDGFTEVVCAEFDGACFWRNVVRIGRLDNAYNYRVKNGSLQRRVFENGRACEVLGWSQ